MHISTDYTPWYVSHQEHCQLLGTSRGQAVGLLTLRIFGSVGYYFAKPIVSVKSGYIKKSCLTIPCTSWSTF